MCRIGIVQVQREDARRSALAGRAKPVPAVPVPLQKLPERTGTDGLQLLGESACAARIHLAGDELLERLLVPNAEQTECLLRRARDGGWRLDPRRVAHE